MLIPQELQLSLYSFIYIKHSIFLFYMLFNVIFKLQYSNNFLYMAI